MNYVTLIKSLRHVQPWHKDEYEARKNELQALAVDCLKCDLNRQYGRVANFSWVLVSETPKKQPYSGDDLVELEILCEFTHREYIGPRHGTVLVHQRVIQKDVISNETVNREYDNGYKFVETIIPEAIRRVGCYCCYGDGPDLNSSSEQLPNGDLVLKFSVNFDFDRSDYVDED